MLEKNSNTPLPKYSSSVVVALFLTGLYSYPVNKETF